MITGCFYWKHQKVTALRCVATTYGKELVEIKIQQNKPILVPLEDVILKRPLRHDSRQINDKFF